MNSSGHALLNAGYNCLCVVKTSKRQHGNKHDERASSARATGKESYKQTERTRGRARNLNRPAQPQCQTSALARSPSEPHTPSRLLTCAATQAGFARVAGTQIGAAHTEEQYNDGAQCERPHFPRFFHPPAHASQRPAPASRGKEISWRGEPTLVRSCGSARCICAVKTLSPELPGVFFCGSDQAPGGANISGELAQR